MRARDGVLVIGALGFENAYALAMRRDRAEALGVRTLDDLARAAPRLNLGADLEFLSRPANGAAVKAPGPERHSGRERNSRSAPRFRRGAARVRSSSVATPSASARARRMASA